MAQPWGLIIILLMRKCQRPGYSNIKITTPEDLEIAEVFLKK